MREDTGLRRLSLTDGPRTDGPRAGDVVVAVGPDLRPGAEQVGADDEGVVRVRVAEDGRVAAVEISGRWGERLLGVEALAAAVLAAYRQALLKRMAARLMNGSMPVAPPPSELPDVDDPRWLEGVRDALDRTYRRLVEVERAQPRDDVVTGPARYVRVRQAAGAVTDVVIDAPRAASETPEAVAEDARAALERARRR